MSEMQRTTTSVTTTSVRYLAKPHGRAQENPPSLGDLRAFVDACDGLPDEARVDIRPGTLSESGRRDVEFSLIYRHPVPAEGAP